MHEIYRNMEIYLIICIYIIVCVCGNYLMNRGCTKAKAALSAECGFGVRG